MLVGGLVGRQSVLDLGLGSQRGCLGWETEGQQS